MSRNVCAIYSLVTAALSCTVYLQHTCQLPPVAHSPVRSLSISLISINLLCSFHFSDLLFLIYDFPFSTIILPFYPRTKESLSSSSHSLWQRIISSITNWQQASCTTAFSWIQFKYSPAQSNRQISDDPT